MQCPCNGGNPCAGCNRRTTLSIDLTFEASASRRVSHPGPSS